jgi:hypothetical protein
MKPLLTRLKAAGYDLHAMSNYPEWWRHIEGKLGVGELVQWSFVSCEGHMRVRRGCHVCGACDHTLCLCD